MPMSPEAKRHRDRRAVLRERRDPWLRIWQDCADCFLPHRADFTTQQAEGASRMVEKFDSTPMMARRGLATAIGYMMHPRDRRWFGLKPDDWRFDEDEESKRWCEFAEHIVRTAIYDPDAAFDRYAGEVDDDLVTFGFGVLLVLRNRTNTGLRFKSLHVKDVYFGEDADGAIDTLYFDRCYTARQAQQLWPDRLPLKVREALAGPDAKPDTKFEFSFAIEPNENFDPRRRGARFAPWVYRAVALTDDSEIVAEGGFGQFPAVIPRWDTTSGESYPRSPAMIALPDALTAQQQAKTILQAGHIAVDPPWLAPWDGIISEIRTFPGGVTYYDPESANMLGGRPPVQPLVSGLNLPYGRDIQKDTRDQIWQAFFRNVLNLPVEGPQMTATEVMERRAEFQRTLGPIIGRLEVEFMVALVRRVLEIAESVPGALPPKPDALLRSGVKIDVESPLANLLRQMDATAIRLWHEDIAVMAGYAPEVTDHLDADTVARDVALARGMPLRYVRPMADVERRRAARQQAQAQQSALAEAQGAAKAIADASKAIPALRSETQ